MLRTLLRLQAVPMTGIALILAFLLAASAPAQGQTYNESFAVGSSGTLSYQYVVQTSECGNLSQTSANTWENFSFTPTGGSAIQLGGSIDYVYSCSAYDVDGGWDYVSNSYSSDGGSNQLALSYTDNGDACTLTFNASEGDSAGSASIGCEAALPTPPSDATYYSNLQLTSAPGTAWTKEGGASTASVCGANPTGTGTLAQGITSPTLGQPGDTSMEMTSSIGNCTEWNELAYKDVCQTTACPSIGNMNLDLYFYIPSGITYNALEFDPDITVGGYTYVESLQCDFAHTGTQGPEWKYYNSDATPGNGWTPFSNPIPCTPGAGWHHLQLNVTMSNAQYSYNDFILDGTELLSSPQSGVHACDGSTSGTFCYGWADRIWVEQQLDNYDNNSSSTETAYYDDYNLVVW